MRNYFFLICLALSGCVSGFVKTPDYSIRQVTELSSKNYRVIKASAIGSDFGFYLFGFIPFKLPSYTQAMINLHKDLRIEGKSTAIVNVTQGQSFEYYILFGIPTYSITADVIEFLDQDEIKQPYVKPTNINKSNNDNINANDNLDNKYWRKKENEQKLDPWLQEK